MNAKHAEKMLDEFTTELVSAIGFKHINSDLYGCPVNDATAILAFPIRVPSSGVGMFTARVSLRFESLARWFDDERGDPCPWASEAIHLLRENKAYTEWEFANADDLQQLRAPVLSDLKGLALPFIARYSRLNDMRKTLESPNKQDWFDAGLDVDARVTVLAAIQMLHGDLSVAVKTLDDGLLALAESLADKPERLRKKVMYKRGSSMDRLRKRLLASG